MLIWRNLNYLPVLAVREANSDETCGVGAVLGRRLVGACTLITAGELLEYYV